MKKVMVVPTYWGRDANTGWQLGDDIYDHPTPVDQEGTLGRLIDSMKILNNINFELVILIVVTTADIIEEAYQKVDEIIKKHQPPVKTYIIGNRELDKIRKNICKADDKQDLDNILCLRGYSNVRNMCLYFGHALGAEVVILIDDDEVFEDPVFVDKTIEFIGGKFYGQTVDGIAGYYLNKEDKYYDDVDIQPWMTFWDRFGFKTKAFDKIIGSKPRLKQTPFAFGGLMVIHRNLYRVVPFDPHLTRGEDIDYVINARMFGFNFYLDNTLAIKHLPPGKEHPIWQRFRQDMYRFFYERAKIKSQYEIPNMNLITAEEFDPYPGEFLKEDLEDKVFKTNVMLALDYLSDNKIEDTKAAIKNIYLSRYNVEPKFNVFEKYLKLQKKWELLLKLSTDNKHVISEIIEKAVQTEVKSPVDLAENDGNIYESILKLPLFKSLTHQETLEFIDISDFNEYNSGQKIVKKGILDDTLYIIRKGTVRIIESREKKDELVIDKLTSGDIFGMSSLVSSKSFYYLVDVVASDKVSVLSIKTSVLMQFLSDHQRSGMKLLLYIIKKLNEQLETLMSRYNDIHLKTMDISSIMKD